MDPLKLKILDEILSHLDSSQASKLKALLDDSKKPPMIEGSPEEESMESPKDEMSEDGKPHGLSVEKVDIMAKPKNPMDQALSQGSSEQKDVNQPGGEEEMSDDELKELINKYLG